jgi:nucleoside-diphosphate-sugar epimerase
VTGACGHFGPWVVQHLVQEGHDVVGVDRRVPTSADELARLEGADLRCLDLLDDERLGRALNGCSRVVHLAAHNSPIGHPPEVVFRNNTGATATVLELAARAGVATAVVASSTSVLGLTYAPEPLSPRYVPIDEEHPVEVLDPYALSKWVDEQTCRTVHRRTGMRVLALRFHWVAPPGAAAERARQLAAGPESAAHELWGYVDARDAARACRLALGSDVGFGVLNIAAADSLAAASTRELVRRFHPTTTIRAGLRGVAGAWSIERARELIGFTPAFSWRDDAGASERGGERELEAGRRR